MKLRSQLSFNEVHISHNLSWFSSYPLWWNINIYI